MDNEKKIKLDELPDEGSEPQVPKNSPAPEKKSPPEPRIESIKKMDQTQRLEALGQRWYFEKPRPRWEWVLVLLILITLQKSGIILQMAEKEFFVPGPDDYANISFFKDELIFLLKYPILLAILIPVFFKFRYPALDYFEINFSGINTIRELDVPGNLAPTRVTAKWDEITLVKMGETKGRPILILFNVDGKVAEMIWDIDEVKKKVIKQVVKGLVSSKNPFRQFIEKDVV